MIAIDQANSAVDPSQASVHLLASPSFSNYIITNFSLEVARNLIGETYSFSNTYSLNFQGVITDLALTSEILSTSIKSRITALLDKSKFDYKVKSLTFPSDNGNPKDLSKTTKFAISFEVRELVASADFTNGDALPLPNQANFNALLPQSIIYQSGDKIRDISESFNIEDGEDGKGTFTHSISFGLMPAPAPTGIPTSPIRPDTVHFRQKARILVESLTVYTTFASLAAIFVKPYSKFDINFFAQNETFTHSESFDLFNFTYSLSRTKSFLKDNSNAAASFSHSYNLVVNEDGIIEITEETKIEGKNKKIGDVKQILDSTIEGPETSVSGAVDGNTYLKVKKSYARCQTFLENYKKLLRYDTTNASIGLSGYSSKTGVDSLRPIAIEVNKTLIPGSPDILYSVKYTNNPNINFGYECDESLKADSSNGIFNVIHSMNLKTFNLKNGESDSFPTNLGSNSYGSSYTQFKDLKILESKTRVYNFLNGTLNVANPYLPVPFLNGITAGLKKNTDSVALALIKQSTNVSERGRNFSLTLTYSSDNKYGPLLYSQDGPDKTRMFANLGLPGSVFNFLKDHFCTFNVKVSVKLPVEKFTQKVIVEKPHAIIEPSFSTSTGALSIVLSGKMKKEAMGIVLPTLNGQIVNSMVKSNFENIVRNVRAKILNGALMTNLRLIITSITAKYFTSNDRVVPSSIAQSISWIPTNVSYKYNSDLDFEMNVDLEFYAKKNSPGPIFYYKTHSIT